MKESISCKGDQPHTVSLKQSEEILGNQLGATKARRNRIGREHAARGIDRDDDIAPLRLDFQLTVAEARLCQPQDHAGNGCQQGDHPKVSLQRTHPAGKLRLKPRGENLGKKHAALSVRLNEKPPEGPHQQKRPDPRGRTEGQAVSEGNQEERVHWGQIREGDARVFARAGLRPLSEGGRRPRTRGNSRGSWLFSRSRSWFSPDGRFP